MSLESITNNRADINELMSKIREVTDKSKIFSDKKIENHQSNFNEIFSIAQNAVAGVNNLQQSTDALKAAYVSGDSKVTMSQLVVSSEKSKLAFEGLLAVRNKILEAYKEIMNMPV